MTLKEGDRPPLFSRRPAARERGAYRLARAGFLAPVSSSSGSTPSGPGLRSIPRVTRHHAPWAAQESVGLRAEQAIGARPRRLGRANPTYKIRSSRDDVAGRSARAARDDVEVHLRSQVYWSQTIMLQPQSHGSAPSSGSSTDHRRQPFVTNRLPAGALRQEIAPNPEDGE